MFWESGKGAKFDANNKFKFLLLFEGFPTAPNISSEDYINGKSWSYSSLNSNLEQTLFTFAKSVNAPNINLEFERAYANEYVHYFQNGSIHWESITIKFADFSKTAPEGNYQTLREILDQYIQYNFLEYDYNGQKIDGVTFPQGANLNRTRVVDMPKFCDKIKISTFPSTAKQDYPTSTALKDLKNGKSFNELYTKYSTIMQETFIIYNPIITKVDFGSFDYSSDDINELTITIVPEWCSFDRNQYNANPPKRDTFGTGIPDTE